jgi:hypothetical protein
LLKHSASTAVEFWGIILFFLPNSQISHNIVKNYFPLYYIKCSSYWKMFEQEYSLHIIIIIIYLHATNPLKGRKTQDTDNSPI